MNVIARQDNQFQPTATNMVNIVDNTINGYRMGPMRALAQEPVQNSKDAASTKNQTVKVVYELHERSMEDGNVAYMLTVTDSGTKGLGGRILDPVQLSAMGGILEQGHDWTAFEGQGYTKRDEDALGSRGQGKSAFLYHSQPPESANGSRRMVIVYDTLLPNGEYRLGVRFANPSDRTMSPPLSGKQAIDTIGAGNFVIQDDLTFPIRLEPLSVPGSRIIIPFLNPETRQAIVDGQLERWLQMSWWRLIQLGQLEIAVIDGGNRRQIEVPLWWNGEPWRRSHNSTEIFHKENIPIPDYPAMRIKRIALACNEDIPDHQSLASSKEPEFDGVQLLRGGQWIETLGRSESWFMSRVPAELRPKFRGFVEFDRKLDQLLRDSRFESPQHDDFKRGNKIVRDIVDQVGMCVAEFSEIAGWTEESDDPNEIERKHSDVFHQVMELFTEPLPDGEQTPGGDIGDATRWTVGLDAEYPNPDSTRVDWGQSLGNVTATCIVTPVPTFGNAKFKLSIINPDGKTAPIHEAISLINDCGQAVAKFGNIPFLKGKSPIGAPSIGCEIPGKYRLRVTVETAEKQTAKANRAIYVQTDPPEPPQRSLTLQVLAKNHDRPDRERINSGENLKVGISLRNRAVADRNLIVDASIVASEVPGYLVVGDDTPGSIELLNAAERKIDGIKRKGETANPVSIFDGLVILLGNLPYTRPAGRHIVLAPGAHRVQVDVRDLNGNQVTSSSKTFWFEADPPSTRQGGLPFELEARHGNYDASGKADPDWWIERESHAGRTKLVYSTDHPLYTAASKADIGSRRANPGTQAYIANICSDALLDWMLEPFLETGDESRFQAIESRRNIDDRWEHLADLVEAYRISCSERNGNHISDQAQQRRTIVANMVRMFTKGN